MTSTATDFALVETLRNWYIFCGNFNAAAREQVMSAFPHGLLRESNVIPKTLARNMQLLGSTPTRMAVWINALPTSNQLARPQRTS